MVTIVSFAVWAYSPYPANDEAVRELYQRDDIRLNSDPHLVIIEKTEDGGKHDGEAMVFFPGARVDPHAYAATFADFVAQTGMTVIIPRPTLNLALADTRSAKDLQALASNAVITAVGGHSLGGVKACQMAPELGASHLVLLASYCASDISASTISVITLLGSNDGLTDLAAVDAAEALIPEGSPRLVLEGLNHASFGDYGPQNGDGVASTPRNLAIQQITDSLLLHWQPTPAG
jgi:hypothetical protein